MNLEEIDDAIAARAFRRLVRHLRHRRDAQNIDLMGLSGFCRNCLGDWLSEASAGTIGKEEGRAAVYGMSSSAWKTKHQGEATPEQIARMNASLALNPVDAPLGESFPASDPPSQSEPGPR